MRKPIVKRKRQPKRNLELNYKCTLCQKHYNSQSALYNHTKKSHQKQTTCQGCQRNYTSVAYRKIHQENTDRCKQFLNQGDNSNEIFSENDEEIQLEINLEEDKRQVDQLRNMIEKAKPLFKSTIQQIQENNSIAHTNTPSLFSNEAYLQFSKAILCFGCLDIDYNLFFQDLQNNFSDNLDNNEFMKKIKDLSQNSDQTKTDLKEIAVFKILKPDDYKSILKYLTEEYFYFFRDQEKDNQDSNVFTFLKEFQNNIQKKICLTYLNSFNKANLFIKEEQNVYFDIKNFDMQDILKKFQISEQYNMFIEQRNFIEPIIQYLFQFFNDQAKQEILHVILHVPKDLEEILEKYQIFSFLIQLKGKDAYFKFIDQINKILQI